MTLSIRPPLPKFLLILLVASSCAAAAAQSGAPAVQPATTSGRFVWISDIHFDPFYAPSSRDSAKVTALLEKLVDYSDPSSPTWKDHTHWGGVFSGSSLQNVYNDRGSDANDAVLQEVLEKASQTLARPDFVVITGDFLGHDFGSDYSSLAPTGMNTAEAYRSFVAQTLAYLALSVRGAFPQPPIIATLGNNDAYCGDYDIHLDHPSSAPNAPGSAFLPDTSKTFLKYFLPNLSPSERTSFLATFRKGGYYALPVPRGGGSRFLVVNSIPFMAKYPCEKCHCSSASDCRKCYAACGSYPGSSFKSSCAASPVIDATAQMSWLTGEAAKPGSAWAVVHVPPGWSCYDSSAMWTSAFLVPFRGLFVGSNPGNVAATLAAHSHMASFKLVRDQGRNAVSFVLQAPSIGSNHDNNPTFGVLTHDPSTLEIKSYQVWYLDLGQPTTTWGHYQFAGLPGSVTAGTLAALQTKLGDPNRADWSTFKRDYGARAPICGTRNYGCVKLGNLSQGDLTCLDSLD